jgi:hypothetical protein
VPARVAILVEGQTEEAFVTQVLQPHLGYENAYLTPIVVHTSRAADGTAFRGGGGKWSHYSKHLQRLLAQPHWSSVTTMIDYYAYPASAPQCSCTGAHRQPECVASREQAIRDAFPHDARFKPFIMLHEFESLVIAAGASSADVLGDSAAAALFRQIVDSYDGNAELINDSPLTAPSKRVEQIMTSYSKVRDGVAIVGSALVPALQATPRFQAWTAELST